MGSQLSQRNRALPFFTAIILELLTDNRLDRATDAPSTVIEMTIDPASSQAEICRLGSLTEAHLANSQITCPGDALALEIAVQMAEKPLP
jgi:hypothetical protein